MRATLTDVAKHPGWARDWWLDTPWRKPRNWRTLLTEPGRGWLRWAWGYAEEVVPILEDGTGPTEAYGVAPPLRRAFDRVRFGKHVKGIGTWARDKGWPEDYLV